MARLSRLSSWSRDVLGNTLKNRRTFSFFVEPLCWMSLAGLRYRSTGTSAPLETKSGSYIYSGEPQGFHEWEFRTTLRVEMCKAKMRSKALDEKSHDRSRSDESGPELGRRERLRRGRMGARLVQPDEGGQDRGDGDDDVDEGFPSFSTIHDSPKSDVSSKSKIDGDEEKDMSSYVEMVQRVMEGLRGDAFLIARDLGLSEILKKDGMQTLIERIRSHVFPLKGHEAKELFRIGQSPTGPLSRQGGETMLSFIQRRRRWWIQLREMDDKMALSDQMRGELLLECSGLSRTEQLMIKTASQQQSFEGFAEVMMLHHGRVHMKDSRSLAPEQRSTFGKGKGKSNSGFRPRWQRQSYYVDDCSYDEDDGWRDPNYVEQFEEPEAYVAADGVNSPIAEEEFEDVSDEEIALALIAMAECDIDEHDESGSWNLEKHVSISCMPMLPLNAAKEKARANDLPLARARAKERGSYVRSSALRTGRHDWQP